MPTMYNLSDITQNPNNLDYTTRRKNLSKKMISPELGVGRMGIGLKLPWANQLSNKNNQPYTVYANQPIADVLGIK